MNDMYIFRAIYLDGQEIETTHQGSLESVKQRYIWYRNNSDIAMVSVFKLEPKELNEGDLKI